MEAHHRLQMSDAVLEKTTARISISTIKEEELVASGEVADVRRISESIYGKF